jgi:RNA recognition motif-containing protein
MSYRILIDPLPRDFSAAALADLLRPFGEVVLTEIVTDSLGYSLGFGRAEMHSEEGADSVVKHLDGKAFHNATLTVLRTEDSGTAILDPLRGRRLAS